ncbi:MAG: metalloregulator ArsR/SmtB family transcription factor [Burkholderiaceae bacterium]
MQDDLEPVLEGVSRYFSLLAEPTRLRILHAICSTEKSVTEIVEETGASQTNVSRHLGTLFSAGVLNRRKQGNFIYYQVSDDTLIEICRTACVHYASRSEPNEKRGSGAKALARDFGARGKSAAAADPQS